MAYQQQVNFPCSHCGHEITAQIKVDAAMQYNADTEATQVEIKDFQPIKCTACGKFVQVEVASLVLEYQSRPLETA